jgi:hypothetical protein
MFWRSAMVGLLSGGVGDLGEGIGVEVERPREREREKER